MQDYKADKKWADTFEGQVITLLSVMMPDLAVIKVATEHQDTQESTDFSLELEGGEIAVRIRRPGCGFRDFTLRSERRNNVKTELAKIKEGHASRYFYGWTDEHGRIVEWILIDLDMLRSSGLLDTPRRSVPNKDGKTFFVPFSLTELHTARCFLNLSLSNKTIMETGLGKSRVEEIFKQAKEKERNKQRLSVMSIASPMFTRGEKR